MEGAQVRETACIQEHKNDLFIVYTLHIYHTHTHIHICIHQQSPPKSVTIESCVNPLAWKAKLTQKQNQTEEMLRREEKSAVRKMFVEFWGNIFYGLFFLVLIIKVQFFNN